VISEGEEVRRRSEIEGRKKKEERRRRNQGRRKVRRVEEGEER